MAEIVLDGAQVCALVGQIVAAAVTQGVWVHVLQAGVPRDRANRIIDALARERLAALRNEQPAQA
jgi:hypothetical protein